SHCPVFVYLRDTHLPFWPRVSRRLCPGVFGAARDRLCGLRCWYHQAEAVGAGSADLVQSRIHTQRDSLDHESALHAHDEGSDRENDAGESRPSHESVSLLGHLSQIHDGFWICFSRGDVGGADCVPQAVSGSGARKKSRGKLRLSPANPKKLVSVPAFP